MSYSNSSDQTIHVGRIIRDIQSVARPAAAPLRPPGPTTETPSRQQIDLGADAYQEGFQAGREAGERQLRDAAQVFRSAAGAFERAQQETLRGLDEHVVTLALAIARKVIDREVRDPNTLHRVLVRAISHMTVKTSARVRLHPSDLALLEEHRAKLRAEGAHLPEELILCPDSSVTRGGCLLESPQGNVDATIETQLGLIGQALRAANEAATEGGDV